MVRAAYRGAVRDSSAESDRDQRMLALAEQGLPVGIIAQRMGVTVNSARIRIKRARAATTGGDRANPLHNTCQSVGDGAEPS